MFCLKCKKSELIQKQDAFKGEVRREKYTIKCEGLVCSKCGFKTLNPEQLDGFRIKLSDTYRKRHGLLTTQEIIDSRRQSGMSQEEFANHVGVGVASLKRWELGKIQDPSNDELLRLKTDPHYANKNKADVSAINVQGDSLYGNLKFDPEKFKNVVAFCIQKIPSLTILYLNKLLFYIDFLYYKYYKTSITGTCYACLEYGPVPDQYKSLFEDLIHEKAIEQKGTHSYKTKIKPELSKFSGSEILIIQYMVDAFKRNPKKYFKLSHEEQAWLQTPDFKLIDYKWASKLKVSLPPTIAVKQI